MIEKMLRGNYGPELQLIHVRMTFSRELDEIGRFKILKVIRLVGLIVRILKGRLQGANILYYPPASVNRLAIWRDLIILVTTRWVFRKTIFHFHAGGLGPFCLSLHPITQFFFRIAFFYPDAAIRLAEITPQDAKALKARLEFIVPNGVEDEGAAFLLCRHCKSQSTKAVNVLFVNRLSEAKGVLVLIDACKFLADRGALFQVRFVGQFESSEFRTRVENSIRGYGLEGFVTFTGVLDGENKWREFAQADLLCLPTYYEVETFGLVLVEAMSFGLPVVASDWRGIPSIIEHGVTGFLVPVRDALALADKIHQLINDPRLRNSMGHAGRKKYLEQFTIQRFHQQMRNVFRTVAELPE
jgi:glycosyltransferase involved in cell wall biosynthesis